MYQFNSLVELSNRLDNLTVVQSLILTYCHKAIDVEEIPTSMMNKILDEFILFQVISPTINEISNKFNEILKEYNM